MLARELGVGKDVAPLFCLPGKATPGHASPITMAATILDVVLIALSPPNRTHAPSSLQNIRLSSDVRTVFSTVKP
jgi:hypothetical protein